MSPLVWAVVYPPSYVPPATRAELYQEDLPTIVLNPQQGDRFAATFAGFTEVGLYRVVVYAEDDTNQQARPLTISVSAGSRLFLPLVRR